MSTTLILFGFDGRIPRSTWWLWSIVVGIVAAVLIFVLAFAALTPALISIDESPTDEVSTGAAIGIFVFSIGTLAVATFLLWISLALGAKRLHDQAKSGWWQLISLIPFGNWVLLIMLGFIGSTPGPNQYGPGPNMPAGGAPYYPVAAPANRGAWVNPPPAPNAPQIPQQPLRRPNEPFQEGNEWRSYDSAGRLLRWDDASQTWLPLA